MWLPPTHCPIGVRNIWRDFFLIFEKWCNITIFCQLLWVISSDQQKHIWHHQYLWKRKKIICGFVVIIVPADGLAPDGARSSAGTLMAKICSHRATAPALQELMSMSSLYLIVWTPVFPVSPPEILLLQLALIAWIQVMVNFSVSPWYSEWHSV